MRNALCLALFASCLVTPAGAVIRRMPDDIVPIRQYHGSSTDLPVDCAHTADELVAWARGLASVQAAMSEFSRRGYIACPDADTAFSGCSSGVTSVFLFYKKPGVADSLAVPIPFIRCATQIDAYSGLPMTGVQGGCVLLNGVTHEMKPACDDPRFSLDTSFRVQRRSSGSDPRHMTPEGITDAFSFLGDKQFNDFIRCISRETVFCVASAMLFGGPGLAPIKASTLAAQPELGAFLIGGCLGLAVLHCALGGGR